MGQILFSRLFPLRVSSLGLNLGLSFEASSQNGRLSGS